MKGEGEHSSFFITENPPLLWEDENWELNWKKNEDKR